MYPISATNYFGYLIEHPLNVEMKEFKISELFDYFGKGKVKSLAKCEEGNYPCISRVSSDNGVAKWINSYDYDTNKLGFNLLSVPDSACYQCFVQTGKFSAQGNMHLLKLKDNYKYLNNSIGLIAFIMSNKFSSYYTYAMMLGRDRLANETIMLPVVIDNDKYTINENLLNNYVYSVMI